MPNRLKFEERLLSAVLQYAECLDEAVDLIEPEDFYSGRHREIFAAALALHGQRHPVDITTVADALMQRRQLKTVGASYLAGLLDIPVASDVGYFCRKIKDAAVMRKTILAARKIMSRCFGANGNAEAVLDEAQKSLLDIEFENNQHQVATMEALSMESMERYETLQKNPGIVTGVPTGFKRIDFLTCGLQPGDMVIIAARPSMGKTALMLNMAVNMAMQDYRALIFSLEMSEKQLFDRIISSLSGVNSMKFRSGRFSGDDWAQITAAAQKIHGRPLFIDDSAALTYQEIRRRARKACKLQNIQVFFLDYLQLVQGDRQHGRTEEISGISRNLKAIAKELELPFVVLSQLSRAVEQRENKRPRLADLRDSGAIEQDADVVMFIYRDEVYNQDGESLNAGKAEVILAKQRNGPTGVAKLPWISRIATFGSALDTDHDADGWPLYPK